MTIVGLQFGQWGIDNFGTSPTRVDTLAFYPSRLRALLQEIKEAQQRCLPPNESIMPAAFVTFTRRKTQVQNVSDSYNLKIFGAICHLLELTDEAVVFPFWDLFDTPENRT